MMPDEEVNSLDQSDSSGSLQDGAEIGELFTYGFTLNY